MQFRTLYPVIALTLTLCVAACSRTAGTSGDGAGGGDCATGGQNAFCLVSCTLGCVSGGCSVNLINQNESITLTFNRDVDKFSVPPYTNSILLRTANGEDPVGDWIVDGNEVRFEPRVVIAGAATFFGFRPNDTYKLHLPAGAGEPSVIRSSSGDELAEPITCVLNIGGIRDLNGEPPRGELISPTATENVSLDSTIVLEFDEILDPSIFADASEEDSPVRVSVRSTRLVDDPANPGSLVAICREGAPPLPLPGTVSMAVVGSRSIVTYLPRRGLPSGKCIIVEITSSVRDLAGVPAVTRAYQFITDPSQIKREVTHEDFLPDADDPVGDRYFDKTHSSGTWENGWLRFSPLGGSGIHGDFEPTVGFEVAGAPGFVRYLWNTDSIEFPANVTPSRERLVVTDGRFFFRSFHVPPGVEVLFTGSNPVRITVAGDAKIEGRLLVNGASTPTPWYPEHNLDFSGNPLIYIDPVTMEPGKPLGEAGGAGGPTGGRGGNGGDKGDGLGHQPRFDGQKGQDVRLPIGHAYAAQVVGTGGGGSPQYPATGLMADISLDYFNFISVQTGQGGGGGGFQTPGGHASIFWDPLATVNSVAHSAFAEPPQQLGGGSYVFSGNFPNYTNGFTAQDHYLVGGSGGGGGGSVPSGSLSGQERWRAGRSGAGGGGAFGMRIGRTLTITPSGRIIADGGSAGISAGSFNALTQTYVGVRQDKIVAVGGGGSGGSVFLQVALQMDNTGHISSAGGTGGQNFGQTNEAVFGGFIAKGGDGGSGLVRVETSLDPDPALYPTGSTTPGTLSVGSLLPWDRDDMVTVRSHWYVTSLEFAPDFERYEIVALVDGVRRVYSDDPEVGDPDTPIYDADFAGLAAGSTSPLRFTIQGAQVQGDTSGNLGPKPNTLVSAYMSLVGPFDDLNKQSLFYAGATGFRYEVLLDRSLGQNVEIESIKIFWRL